MVVKITLSLPEDLVTRAERFGRSTQQDLAAVLTDALELMWPTLDELPDLILPPVSKLSDGEVLALADLKMDREQNRRLGELQAKGKEEGLTADERYELLALMQIYRRGQLRKSEAMAEAVRRGLRTSYSNEQSV